ncbi:MAG: hypothetical protein A2Y17_00515 [Clostridiales bacterium GWF2_38_85]|nr:MAG: hypothetical protein A2Y17_00515 [Clostridiales bacterium GWF2_38_85]HBL83523.1 hypothetical protein [Clostridiales bacterium]
MKKAILVFSLLLIFSVLLASCKATTGDESSATSSEATSSAVSEEESGYNVSIPEMDMDELEIRFLVAGSENMYYESFDIYSEELNNELLNDEIYNRNHRIQEKYNCVITEEKVANVATTAEQYMRAGTDDFDIYMPYLHNAVSLASQGYFYNLYDLDNLNLDQPYWDQKFNEYLTINEKLYFSTGDISMLDNECTMVMFFNKDLITDYNLEDPYTLVQNKEWTLDKVYEISKGFTLDNGDSKFDQEDRYGLHVAFNAPHSFFFSCGGRITNSTTDGGFELAMKSGKNIALIQHIFEITNDSEVLTNNTSGCNSFEAICEMFVEGRVMFTTFALVDMLQFKDAENFNFGILPYPLDDSNQDEYTCLVSTSLVPVVCIPTTNTHLDETTIIVDALARESAETVTPAYYEKILKKRTLQDNDSEEMLDIIFASRAYDVGYVFNWGGIGSMLEGMYGTNKEFVSTYDSLEGSALTAMNDTIQTFELLN